MNVRRVAENYRAICIQAQKSCQFWDVVVLTASDEQQKIYYDGLVRCDDPMCNLETRQLSVMEGCCLKQGCNGRMKTVYTESMLQTQLKYFDSLFDMSHALKQLKKSPSTMTEKEIVKSIGSEDKAAFQMMHGFSGHALNQSGYNFVSGQFFQTLFGAYLKS